MGREYKYNGKGRPVDEGNGPLEMFDEFCIQQYFRIRDSDGLTRRVNAKQQTRPSSPRLVEKEVFANVSPKRDPDAYEYEVRK